MTLGNKLIDSALRKAIHPIVLFITRMPIRSNSRLFFLIRNNRTQTVRLSTSWTHRSVPLKVNPSRWRFGDILIRDYRTKFAHLDSPQSWQILFVRSKEQLRANCNHHQPSATILNNTKMLCSLAHGFTTWLYCAGSARARARANKTLAGVKRWRGRGWVTNGLWEHSRVCEHCDFLASTSRDKKNCFPSSEHFLYFPLAAIHGNPFL